jgi:hypothetical protein
MTASTRLWRTFQELPAWGTAEAPPTEFLLFPFGPSNATFSDGSRDTVYLTQQNAQKIVEEWIRREIPGMFDFNHDFGLSWGWYWIEVRADGLWVVDIDWTQDTLEYFKLKKIRFYSPAFNTVKDDEGRNLVISLLNIALTNLPATDNQRPLIARSRRQRPRRRQHTMDTPSLEDLKAKAQELIDTFGAKGDLMDIVMWLDKLLRGDSTANVEPGAAAEEADPLIEETATEDDKEDEMIAATAKKVTGLKGRACVGALNNLRALAQKGASALKELSTLKHKNAVELALKERKITPAQKKEALESDPEEFRGAMKWAQPILDDTEISAKTREPKDPDEAAKELAKNPKLIAYCAEKKSDPLAYAQQWVAKFGTEPFTL